MVRIRDLNARQHSIARDAIAQLSEAGPSAGWHGIRTFVKLFDGSTIESTDTLDFIEAQMKDDA